MKSLLILSSLLALAVHVRSQKIVFDKTGRTIAIEKTENLSTGSIINFNLAALDTEFNDEFHKTLIDSCHKRITETLLRLNSPDKYAHYDFLSALITEDSVQRMIDELNLIDKYLTDGRVITVQRLNPLYQHLKKLVNATSDDWYTINNDPIAARDYTVKAVDLEPTGKSYRIELRVNHLLNKFITDLFNDTYSYNDMDQYRGLTKGNIDRDRKTLGELLKTVGNLGKIEVNEMTDQSAAAMRKISSDWPALPAVISLQNSTHLENWIWWRPAELTINPFEKYPREKPGADQTVQPASANISQLDLITKKSANINQVWLRQKKSKERYISVFTSADNTTVESAELDKPVESTEDIIVSVHNVPAGEKAGLQLTKETAHNGYNDVINGIDEALNLLLNVYGVVNPAAKFWTDAADAITKLGTVQKNATPDLLDSFPNFKSALPLARNTDQFWNALVKDLEKQSRFNEFLFDAVRSDYAAQANSAISIRNTPAINALARNIISNYNLRYGGFVSLRKTLSTDSLVIATLFRFFTESSQPPATVSLVKDKSSFSYNTSLLNTGTSNKNASFEYAVKTYSKVDGKLDSTVIANFKYKNGKRQRLSASVGVVYTFADEFFAHNKVIPGDPITIESKSDRVSFTFGLHIYPCKIFTLDDGFLYSASSPWYERLSIYTGFGIPKVFKNFYPGVSYDIIPGIRIIGGGHLYVHERFKIVNNSVEKQTSRIRSAGPFLSLNIYPLTFIKEALK